jgi:hypothetical protein
VSERTCSMRECHRTIHARGLCGPHYLKARLGGEFTPVKPDGPLHRITNADPLQATGDCEVCGPGVPIRVRPGRGHECKARRRENQRLRQRRNRRRNRARWNYGLTVEDIERMKVAQGGRCAICERVPDRLVVDHDHTCCSRKKRSCGKCVRGLLCDRCNIALGYWRDNPQLAIASAEYLLR